MNKVLITGGLSALAQRVAKNFENEHVFFADSNAMPTLFKNKFVRIPDVQKVSFVHELLALCLDLSIKYLIPLKNKEILALITSKSLFEEYGIILCLPEKNELAKLDVIIEPSRSAYPDLIVNTDANGPVSMLGVYVTIKGEDVALCSVN